MKFGGGKGYTPSEQTEGSSERWIKGFRDGSTIVRFLEPSDEWTPYWEHYDSTLGTKGAYFPCTGERNTCPGCTSDSERTARASKRWLSNALVGRYVDIYKIPSSLADKIITRAASKDDGDVTKRDYEIIRGGVAPKIEYDVEREDATPIDIGEYVEKFQDHEAALQRLWDHAFGGEAPPEPVKPKEEPPAERTRRPKPPTAQEVEDAAKAAESSVKHDSGWSEPAKEDADDIGDPPSEPQQSEGGAAEETVEMTEEELRAMEPAKIKELIAQCGFEVPDLDDSDALADYFIDQLG